MAAKRKSGQRGQQLKMQVHTDDQSVLPTPRHSFVALSFAKECSVPLQWYQV